MVGCSWWWPTHLLTFAPSLWFAGVFACCPFFSAFCAVFCNFGNPLWGAPTYLTEDPTSLAKVLLSPFSFDIGMIGGSPASFCSGSVCFSEGSPSSPSRSGSWVWAGFRISLAVCAGRVSPLRLPSPTAPTADPTSVLFLVQDGTYAGLVLEAFRVPVRPPLPLVSSLGARRPCHFDRRPRARFSP